MKNVNLGRSVFRSCLCMIVQVLISISCFYSSETSHVGISITHTKNFAHTIDMSEGVKGPFVEDRIIMPYWIFKYFIIHDQLPQEMWRNNHFKVIGQYLQHSDMQGLSWKEQFFQSNREGMWTRTPSLNILCKTLSNKGKAVQYCLPELFSLALAEISS